MYLRKWSVNEPLIVTTVRFGSFELHVKKLKNTDMCRMLHFQDRIVFVVCMLWTFDQIEQRIPLKHFICNRDRHVVHIFQPWPCSVKRSASEQTAPPRPCRSACWPEWGRAGPAPAAARCRRSLEKTRGWCFGRRWTGAHSVPPQCATACSYGEPWREEKLLLAFRYISSVNCI